MAKGKQLAEVRRGILCSTTAAFLVSVLILIVGAGAATRAGDAGEFSISDFAQSMKACVGGFGTTIFAIGFVAAAFSSMLTVIVGALLVANSLLFAPSSEAPRSLSGQLPSWSYWVVVLSIAGIAALVVILGISRETFIMLAQLFNGMLLPVFCTCLLVCMKDADFLAKQAQNMFDDIWLHCCVAFTYFLATRLIINKACDFFGWRLPSSALLLMSASVSILAVLAIYIRMRRGIVEGQAPGDLEGQNACSAHGLEGPSAESSSERNSS